MDRLVNLPMRVGAWHVDPVLSQLTRDQDTVKVEARAMRLLMYLAQRAGEVVSIDELLNEVWAGVIVTPDSVYQAVASLRRLLGDDPKQARYIATVPRLGYRMVAEVAWPGTPEVAPVNESLRQGAETPALSSAKPSHAYWMAAIVALCLVLFSLGVAYRAHQNAASAARASIAVLPFLDLTTQEMNEEFFADGLTEELIGDLSKVATFNVPSPTATFALKGKQIPPAEIARRLGVAYILDGSVRKSNNTYRVATRLIRADTGYVVWSETYDRPLGDLVQVQKDIALQATKAIRVLLEAKAAEV
jgi:transcriptional activator of cad operon